MSIEQLNCDVYVTKQEKDIKRLRKALERARPFIDFASIHFTHQYKMKHTRWGDDVLTEIDAVLEETKK